MADEPPDPILGAHRASKGARRGKRVADGSGDGPQAADAEPPDRSGGSRTRRRAKAVDADMSGLVATIPMDVVPYDAEAFQRIANELRQQDVIEVPRRATRLVLEVNAGEPIIVHEAEEAE